jgi:hypothetical protein
VVADRLGCVVPVTCAGAFAMASGSTPIFLSSRRHIFSARASTRVRDGSSPSSSSSATAADAMIE